MECKRTERIVIYFYVVVPGSGGGGYDRARPRVAEWTHHLKLKPLNILFFIYNLISEIQYVAVWVILPEIR